MRGASCVWWLERISFSASTLSFCSCLPAYAWRAPSYSTPPCRQGARSASPQPFPQFVVVVAALRFCPFPLGAIVKYLTRPAP
ncbi:hypothetical protein DFJ73DRAFT_836692 [Zopfochytrium polystomum]|nr:hypothetical protein DFJ73DRAFT_836692 [Zopfochytrium polystomum]